MSRKTELMIESVQNDSENLTVGLSGERTGYHENWLQILRVERSGVTIAHALYIL